MGTWYQIFLAWPISYLLKSAISPTGNVILKVACYFLSLFLFFTSFLKCGAFKSCCCLMVFLPFRIPMWQNALSSPLSMRIPHSNAFIDLNKDFTAGKWCLSNVQPWDTGVNFFRSTYILLREKCYQIFVFPGTKPQNLILNLTETIIF